MDTGQFAVKGGRGLLQPFDIGIRIRGGLYHVSGLHEARQTDVFADILDDDIRCGAPIADGCITVGKREAVERQLIGALHHFEIGDRGAVEAIAREGADAGKIALQRSGIGTLASGRLILQPAAKIAIFTHIDAEAGGAFGFVLEEVVGDAFEQLVSRLARGGAGDRGASAEGEGSGGAQSGEELAAGGVEGRCRHARSMCAPRITKSNQSRNSAGTLPPLADSSRMVRLCSQTLSSALPE